MLNNEQFIAAQKAQFDTLLGLSYTGLEATEKLIALNMETAKAALGEVSEKATAAFSAKDPQSLFAMQGELLQPAAEKAAAYVRKVYDITTAAQAEVGKVAEAGAADAQQKFAALVDSAAKNAPAGSENVVSLMKAAVAATNDAYENLQKAGRQAAGAAEANFNSLSAVATKATSTGKSKRAA